MKYKFLFSVVILGAVFFFASEAEAMRCGGRLVSRGDHVVTVIEKCGEPTHVVQTVEYRSVRAGSHSGHAHYQEADHTIQIQVEIWTYNLGPHRFMRELRFENGVLVRERSLGYGH